TMIDETKHDRRGFLSLAGLAFAAARLGLRAPPAPALPTQTTAFGPLKQIDPGVLNIGYVEAGPANGRPVLLRHGWPYDIHSYADVAPLLAAKGYRVIVPFLRGYGTTRFHSSSTFRNGQQSAIATDIKALMDALRIDKAIIGGFDWGSRTADVMA